MANPVPAGSNDDPRRQHKLREQNRASRQKGSRRAFKAAWHIVDFYVEKMRIVS